MSPKHPAVLDEESFVRMISLERKRTERSRKLFVLMLIDRASDGAEAKDRGLDTVISVLFMTTRETDTIGWYQNGSALGVMFTELNLDDTSSVLAALRTRVTGALRKRLALEQFSELKLSFYVFPETWSHSTQQSLRNSPFYPELRRQNQTQRSMLLVKRLMDLVGSVAALIMLAPIFLLIAVAVRLTSQGPVLFRQPRLGQGGVTFELLKFRSMRADNDSSIHREYVKKLVNGTAQRQAANGKDEGVYKLTVDPRVTWVGGFLRRASLDELPQFLNVLKGDMSLVGPRPPLPYEVEAYDLWHRRRVLEAKPGLTGLWQVSGRNRVNFDDMVRLDLMYSRTWSPWLDLIIMLRTPRAVVEGAH